MKSFTKVVLVAALAVVPLASFAQSSPSLTVRECVPSWNSSRKRVTTRAIGFITRKISSLLKRKSRHRTPQRKVRYPGMVVMWMERLARGEQTDSEKEAVSGLRRRNLSSGIPRIVAARSTG